MGLTPLDIENTRFRSALAGFNKLEVDHFMQRVAATLEEKLEDIQRLQQQVKSLSREVEKNREMEDLLKNSMILAQRTCDEIISSAHKKADLIRQEANAEGQQIRWRYAELKSDHEQFEYAFHGLLSGFMHRLEQGNPELAKPDEPVALPAKQHVEPESKPVDANVLVEKEIPSAQSAQAEENTRAPFEGEVPVQEKKQQPETPATSKSPSQGLPFEPNSDMPKVVLTKPSDQSVDRDSDMFDFENAVSDAKTDEPQWTPPVDTDEEVDAVPKRLESKNTVENPNETETDFP